MTKNIGKSIKTRLLNLAKEEKQDYPLLLPDVPAVELYAYSLETLIAEKFHTMVDRDESNSRMKDFFDVYQLFTYHEIDKALLEEAIVSTFKNRNTSYKDNLALFTNTFVQDDTRECHRECAIQELARQPHLQAFLSEKHRWMRRNCF